MGKEKHPDRKQKDEPLTEGQRSVTKWDADEEEEISNLSYEKFVELIGLDHPPRPQKAQSRKG